MADEVLSKIQKLEGSDIFSRMDDHKKLYSLEPFILTINDRQIPDIINITLNDPQTYADYIISMLANSNQQIEITGKGEVDKIEEFLTAIYDQAQEYLTNQEYDSFNGFDFFMACLRGRVARRITLRHENGKFVPDILPLDTRFLVYEYNRDGITMASYRINKTVQQVRELYPDFKDLKGLGTDSADIECRDVWTNKEHMIYAVGDPYVEPNPYGYVPVAIQVCNTGNNMMDTDMRKYKGNSIYAGVEQIYPHLNEVVSMLATLNAKTIMGNQQFPNPEGANATPPEQSPFGLRTVIPIDKDAKFLPMPIEDIRQATTMLWNILEQRKQEATISSTKYGNLDFSLSAVAITKLGSETDKILYPRIQAVANLNMKSARMIIKQLKQIGGSVQVGELGNFDTSILNGDYSIKYNYHQTDPTQDIANLSKANAAKEFYSPDSIMRDILKIQDPGAEMVKKRIAKWEAVGANGMSDSELYQVIHNLRDEDRNIESEMALRSLEGRYRMAAGTNQPAGNTNPVVTPTGQTNANQNVIPLTDSTGRRAVKSASEAMK